MDNKELLITAKRLIENNEYEAESHRKTMLQFIEAMTPLVFKSEARKGAFDLCRWIQSAAATSKEDKRRVLHNVFVGENETCATNGRILHVYAGRLNGLNSGIYSVPTMQQVTDVGTYPNYKQVIPTKYVDSCEISITNFACRNNTMITLADNGDVINNDTKTVVGRHTLRKCTNLVIFFLKQLANSLDKQTGTFKMSIAGNMDQERSSVCRFDINKDCFAIVMSCIPTTKA